MAASTANLENPKITSHTSDLVYPYIKLREQFGRQQRCLEDHWRVHANVKPNKKYRKLVAKKTMVNKDVQAIPASVLTEMNTIRAEYTDFTLMHTEGGWPKDVSLDEPEQLFRYRKKLEKEDPFQAAIPVMTDEMEELIKNNNAMNFYRKGYKCKPVVGDKDLVPSATVVSVYKNPAAPQGRPVRRITFAPDNAGRMCVAQAPFEYDPTLREHPGEAFFWEIENPSRPEGMVRAGSHITDCRYHPKDLHSICGSLFTGQVATWDNRVGPSPQAISAYEVSHQDVCTSALWINSKSGCEFFSSGLDGQIIWWDERNLSEALDTVWCDPEKGQMRPELSVGSTVLEYEHTLPTKFLTGTERGQIMVFMKKGKSPNERMVHMYKAHKGPVRALHRNPMFIKNFMTVGDYHIRIFAEDCRESAIMWTIPAENIYSDANWLTGRPSGFVACRVDGILEWWDLLIQGASSILKLQVCEEALTAVTTADGGKHVAAGTKLGDVRFVKMTDFMGEFEKNDKPVLAGVFDRESRREKYLEQRNREIRLKKRDAEKKETEAKKKLEEETEKRKADGVPEAEAEAAAAAADIIAARAQKIQHEAMNNPIMKAEREFFVSIANEIQSKGIDAFPEKRKAVEEKNNDLDMPAQSETDIVITAADLAAMDFDDGPSKQGSAPQIPEGEAGKSAASSAPPAPPTGSSGYEADVSEEAPQGGNAPPKFPPEEEDEEEGFTDEDYENVEYNTPGHTPPEEAADEEEEFGEDEVEDEAEDEGEADGEADDEEE